MHRCLLLWLAAAAVAAGVSAAVIPTNDSNWYFTPQNWLRLPNGCMQTAVPGAYFKVGFTGSANVAVLLNQSHVGSEQQWRMKVLWSLDDLPARDKSLRWDTEVQTIEILSNASTLQNHTLYAVLLWQKGDRWLSTDDGKGPYGALRICGLRVDDGTRSLPYAPGIKSIRVLAYGDSIGEGRRSGIRGKSNDATRTWPAALAVALQAELTQIAFSGQGYTSHGGGHIPCFHWPNKDRDTGWNKYDSAHSVLVNGRFEPEPDLIFNGHGTNDFLHPKYTDPPLVERALDWLFAIRRAAPHARVFLCVPFGGYRRTDLREAFVSYQDQTTDPNAFLLDIGEAAEYGIIDAWNPTYEAYDGLHPFGWRNQQLGAMLAVEATRAIALGAVRHMATWRGCGHHHHSRHH